VPIVKLAFFTIAVLALAVATDDAWARGRSGARSHHHHHHRSIIIGAPFMYPYPYYPYPYFYYPLPLPYAAEPPVYVEKYSGTPTPETQDSIFCPNEDAYYPEVKDCPGGWQRVIPQEQPAPG
jgi:hypothetical protein